MNMVSLASLSIPTCQASLSQPHRPFVSPHCHQHQASTDTKLQDTDLIFIHLFQSKQTNKKCCCYNGKTKDENLLCVKCLDPDCKFRSTVLKTECGLSLETQYSSSYLPARLIPPYIFHIAADSHEGMHNH